MVQAVRSPHDLDNIHLQEVPGFSVSFSHPTPLLFRLLGNPRFFFLQVSGTVAAEYELEHLLLEGHCFDLSTGQPPRGLQFTLGMSRDPLMYDTIVMANLVRSLTKSFISLIGFTSVFAV